MRCSSLTSFPLIDTSSVGNLNDTWRECSSLISFPLIDTSGCTTLGYTWLDCSGLTSFPLLNTSNVTDFDGAWRNNSSLTSFPLIDTSSGSVFGGQNSFQSLGFTGTWQGCTGLTSFPALNFDNGTIFEATWLNCTNLADFPPNLFDNCAATNFTVAWRECALTAESIENILVSIDAGGALNGILDISLGTNAAYGDWTAPAIVAFDNLEAKGWNILYNNLANRWLAYSTINEGAVNSYNSAVGPGGEIYSFIANSTGSELSKFSIFGNLEWSKTISPPNAQFEWGPVAVSQTVYSLPDNKVLTVVDDSNGNHHFICLNSSGQTIYNQAFDGAYNQSWMLRELNNARTQMLVSELQQYQPHFCNLIDVTNGSFLKRFSFTRSDSEPVWYIRTGVQKPDGNWVLGGYLNTFPYPRFLVEVDETLTNVVQAVDLVGDVSLDAIVFHEESGGYLLLDGGGGGKIHLLDEFLQPTQTRTFGGWPTSMRPSPTGFYIWNSYVNFYSDLGMPGWPSLVNLIDYDWNLNEVSFFTQVNGISPYSTAASLDTVNQRVIITPSGIGLYGGGGGTAAYKYVSSLDFLQPLTAGGTPIFADNPPGYGLYARSEINPTTLPVIGPPTITATSVSMSIVPESNVPTIAPTLSFQNSAQTFDLVVSTVPGPPVPPPVASSSWFQSVDDWKYNADATQIWPGP